LVICKCSAREELDEINVSSKLDKELDEINVSSKLDKVRQQPVRASLRASCAARPSSSPSTRCAR